MATVAASNLFAELRPALQPSLAATEADRCLLCGGPEAEAPCVTACPADVDIPSFMDALARGDDDSAATTVFAANLLSGTCARVCPVEVLCEGACVLEREGRRPVEIGRLHRYAADHGLAAELPPRLPLARRPGNVAVIGAGPAGLACAGELAALGYRPVVYDLRPEAGGLARYAIAPYRQLAEPLPAELELVRSLGADVRLGEAIDSKTAFQRIEDDADAVFLAVGMGADAVSGLPGEDLAGVWRSLELIELIKTGEPPWLGDTVVVIGGGNTAIDAARLTRRLGARDVTLVYRRTQAEMPAYPHEVAEAAEEGVRFEWLAAPVAFSGTDRLVGVRCTRMTLGAPGPDGRRRPQPIDGSEFELPADSAVLAIGQEPRSELFGWIDGMVAERGRPLVDGETAQTTNPKYFAGGDAVNGGATAVEAVRWGKLAARGIDTYLRSGDRGHR